MSRLKIDHITRYSYEGTVSRSHNEARMTPVSDDEQHVITAELAVKPSSASIHNYVDYFGTRVADFDIPYRHTVLEVRSSATVDVDRSAAGDADVEKVGWEQLRDPQLLDTHAEYIAPTSLTAAGEELRAVAEQVRETAETPDAATREINWLVDDEEKARRQKEWEASGLDQIREKRGILYKYARDVKVSCTAQNNLKKH